MSFWKTPVGKIFSHGIHEHNSGLGMIINYALFIERLNEKGELTDEKLKEYLQKIKDNKNKCEEAMDYVYTEIKKLQEE